MSVAMKCDICGKLYEKSECSHALKLSKRMISGNYIGFFEGGRLRSLLRKTVYDLDQHGMY